MTPRSVRPLSEGARPLGRRPPEHRAGSARCPTTCESSPSGVVPGRSTDLAIRRDLWEDGFPPAAHARAVLHVRATVTRVHVGS